MDYFNENGDLVWEATELDHSIRLAMIELGWIIPTTPEEVAIAEKAMEGLEIKLPEALREPPFHLLKD